VDAEQSSGLRNNQLIKECKTKEFLNGFFQMTYWGGKDGYYLCT